MASLKLAFLLALFCLVYCSKDSILLILAKFGNYVPLTAEELQELAEAPEEDLPGPVQELVRRTVSGEHVCCRSTPMEVKTYSRRVRRIRTVKDKVVSGHSGCHLFGTGTCNTYTYVYRYKFIFELKFYL